MKLLLTTPLLVASLGLVSPLVQAETLTFESGFYAKTQRAISLQDKVEAFTYQVLGGGKMRLASQKKPLHFSFDCLGFDEAGGQTKGEGRCQWRDKDDHKLFVSLRTEGEGNAYTITGGTGKWQGASGELKSTFVYLPSPSASEFLGTETGSGKINIKK